MTEASRRGEGLFGRIGCATCHVPDWHLEAAAPNVVDYTKQYAGDRRFFELRVAYNDSAGRLEGRAPRFGLEKAAGRRARSHRRSGGERLQLAGVAETPLIDTTST